MRAVRGAHNAVARQQLREVDTKYRAGANELEKEPSLQILQPTNAEQLKQLTSLVEALRRQNLGDPAWQNALRFWQMQITTGALSDRVKFEFVRRFYFWLLGRGTTDDTKRTMWGRGNAAVINREVALYIEQFAQRRLDYALELSLLAGRVPDTLNGYYLYFKYIVNGKLQRAKDNSGGSWWSLSDDDYLQDFELFQQEFGGDGSPHYKDMIRPAATGDNSKRFDASRPYPASGADMERNKHTAATTAEILAQTVQQQNEGRNEPLPQKLDENEPAQVPPQHEPPVNAVPTPANEAAVGIAPNPQVERLIGEVAALRRELPKQSATTPASEETGRHKQERKAYKQEAQITKQLLSEALASNKQLSTSEQARLNGHITEVLRSHADRLIETQQAVRATNAELTEYRQIAKRTHELMQQHIEARPHLSSNLIAAQQSEMLRVRTEAARDMREAMKTGLQEAFEAFGKSFRQPEAPPPQLIQANADPQQIAQAVAKEVAGANATIAHQLQSVAQAIASTMTNLQDVRQRHENAMLLEDRRDLDQFADRLQVMQLEASESIKREQAARADADAAKTRLSEVMHQAVQGAKLLKQRAEEAVQAERERLQKVGRQLLEEEAAKLREQVEQTQRGQTQMLQIEAQKIVQKAESVVADRTLEAQAAVNAAREETRQAQEYARQKGAEAQQMAQNLRAMQAAMEELQREGILKLEAPEEELPSAPTVPPKDKGEADEPEETVPAAEPAATAQGKRRAEAEPEAAPLADETKKPAVAKRKQGNAALTAYKKVFVKMAGMLQSTYDLQLDSPNDAWDEQKAKTELDLMRSLLNDTVVAAKPFAEVRSKYGRGKAWRTKM